MFACCTTNINLGFDYCDGGGGGDDGDFLPQFSCFFTFWRALSN